MASGGKAARSCLGWPGWPPMRRLSCPCGGGDLGGLTMSEDGGLEEVEESLRKAASCCPSWATTCLRAASSASRASTRAWSRRHLVQRTASLALMAVYSTSPATAGTTPVNGDGWTTTVNGHLFGDGRGGFSPL